MRGMHESRSSLARSIRQAGCCMQLCVCDACTHALDSCVQACTGAPQGATCRHLFSLPRLQPRDADAAAHGGKSALVAPTRPCGVATPLDRQAGSGSCPEQLQLVMCASSSRGVQCGRPWWLAALCWLRGPLYDRPRRDDFRWTYERERCGAPSLHRAPRLRGLHARTPWAFTRSGRARVASVGLADPRGPTSYALERARKEISSASLWERLQNTVNRATST
eukprot:364100-Chlamydomonas_euryale.AAC.53